MKNKRILLLGATLVLCLLIAATATTLIIAAQIANERRATNPMENIGRSIADIKDVHNYDELFRPPLWQSAISFVTFSMQHMIDHFPIEYRRVIDEDTILVVYRALRDGELVYLYCYFKNFNFEGVVRTNKANEWVLIRGSEFLSTGELEHADFARIEVGSRAVDVMAIDRITKFHIDVNPDNSFNRKAGAHSSYHILRDGILQIEYRIDENGQGFVKSMEFNRDFIFRSPIGGDEMNLSLTPNDFVARAHD